MGEALSKHEKSKYQINEQLQIKFEERVKYERKKFITINSPKSYNKGTKRSHFHNTFFQNAKYQNDIFHFISSIYLQASDSLLRNNNDNNIYKSLFVKTKEKNDFVQNFHEENNKNNNSHSPNDKKSIRNPITLSISINLQNALKNRRGKTPNKLISSKKDTTKITKDKAVKGISSTCKTDRVKNLHKDIRRKTPVNTKKKTHTQKIPSYISESSNLSHLRDQSQNLTEVNFFTGNMKK